MDISVIHSILEYMDAKTDKHTLRKISQVAVGNLFAESVKVVSPLISRPQRGSAWVGLKDEVYEVRHE
jgi:hypothetical protein